jgi:hypothetical protein
MSRPSDVLFSLSCIAVLVLVLGMMITWGSYCLDYHMCGLRICCLYAVMVRWALHLHCDMRGAMQPSSNYSCAALIMATIN